MSFVGTDGQVRTGPAWSFIGVYSGRIDDDSDLGIVWKRHALEEIVNYGRAPADPWVPPLEASPEDLVPHVDNERGQRSSPGAATGQ